MIQGYGGETAKAIQSKLKINKAVNITDPNGKIQAQQVTLGVSERLSWLKMLRRDIFQLGMAIDTGDETFGTAPSGVALKFKYTQLDMKADRMIVKLKKAMKGVFPVRDGGHKPEDGRKLRLPSDPLRREQEHDYKRP
jgi:hypothetical protein